MPPATAARRTASAVPQVCTAALVASTSTAHVATLPMAVAVVAVVVAAVAATVVAVAVVVAAAAVGAAAAILRPPPPPRRRPLHQYRHCAAAATPALLACASRPTTCVGARCPAHHRRAPPGHLAVTARRASSARQVRATPLPPTRASATCPGPAADAARWTPSTVPVFAVACVARSRKVAVSHPPPAAAASLRSAHRFALVPSPVARRRSVRRV